MSGGLRRIAAISIVATLVGCSDDGPGPTVLASRTPIASVAPSASPAPTALTPQGAADFARYFYAVLDEAFLTGRTSALEPLMDVACSSCQRLLESVRAVYDDGGYFRGGQTTVLFSESPAIPDSPTTMVSVVYDSAALQVYDRSGKQIDAEPAEKRVEATVELRQANGGWVVVALSRRRPT